MKEVYQFVGLFIYGFIVAGCFTYLFFAYEDSLNKDHDIILNLDSKKGRGDK